MVSICKQRMRSNRREHVGARRRFLRRDEQALRGEVQRACAARAQLQHGPGGALHRGHDTRARADSSAPRLVTAVCGAADTKTRLTVREAQTRNSARSKQFTDNSRE